MALTKIVFKIACPEYVNGEPNSDGLALVAEFNEELRPFEDDQNAVRTAFSQIDEELVEKYELVLTVHLDIGKWYVPMVFKITCPEFIAGEANTDGLALAEDLNGKLERLNDKHLAVKNELHAVDDELVEKYQLTVIAVIECQTW